MKLTDLDPHFVGGTAEGKRQGVGVMFDCPCGCDSKCYVQFSNPLDGGPLFDAAQPKWQRTGETLEDLTLTPSIHRSRGCGWHGCVTAGEIITV